MKHLVVDYNDVEELEEVEREYKKGYKSVLIHVYSGIVDNLFINSVCTDLHNKFPEALIGGTISAGEIKRGKKLEEAGVVLSALFFNESDISIKRYDGVSGCELSIGNQICDYLNS